MQIRNSTLAWSAAGMFAVGTAAGLVAPTVLHAGPAAPSAPTVPSAEAAAPVGAHAANLIAPIATPNYRAIVAENQAAVVGITTAGAIKMSNPGMPGDSDDPANDALSQFFKNLPAPRQHGTMHAQGSGFIVASDGVILTNAHVVDGASEVKVKLSDHREYKARVLGADKRSDIAVLKIDVKDLPTVRIGNSDKLGVGDYVLAIGEPFGLEETATAGIVSAKSRSLPGDGYVPFIQTDAAVNPGNSGGPLFDANGAVVGINAQIYSNSGGFQGVSFAIPINLAVGIKEQIVKTGKVSHSVLGVQVQTLDQTLADSFRLRSPNGALVANVSPDSAAQRAGIKAGDVILKVNDESIVDAGQLSARIGAVTPGDKVAFDLWRSGKPLTVTAVIGSETSATAQTQDGSSPARLGLALRPRNSRERQGGEANGLVVEEAQGHAADAGIQRGDVILSVDGTPVESVAQLRKIVQEHDKQVALLIERGDTRLFVPVTLG
jgi:serine protease Do